MQITTNFFLQHCYSVKLTNHWTFNQNRNIIWFVTYSNNFSSTPKQVSRFLASSMQLESPNIAIRPEKLRAASVVDGNSPKIGAETAFSTFFPSSSSLWSYNGNWATLPPAGNLIIEVPEENYEMSAIRLLSLPMRLCQNVTQILRCRCDLLEQFRSLSADHSKQVCWLLYNY
jgi:hypothetical protein